MNEQISLQLLITSKLFVKFGRLSVTLIIAFSIGSTFVASLEESVSDGDDICNNVSCFEVAKYLYANLDETVNPCDDFYKFSCGGWRANNPITNTLGQSATLILQEKSIKQFISILEDDILYGNRSLLIHKSQQFYRSCRTSNLKEYENIQNLRTILTEFGFPMIDSEWDSKQFSWLTAVTKADIQLGIQTFFNISVDVTEDEYKPYIKEPTFNNYSFNYIERTLKQMNNDTNTYTLYSDFNDVINLITQLSKMGVGPDNGSCFENVEQEMSIQEMYEEFPNIDWNYIFRTLFRSADIEINQNQSVTVLNVNYYKKLGTFLKNSDSRAIANYIALRVLNEFGSQSVYAFREISDEREAKYSNRLHCTLLTEAYFALPLSYFYVNRFIKQESLTQLKTFIQTMKYSFTNSLKANDWMDERTKFKAQLKLQKMMSYIAIPNWIHTVDDINKYYSNLGSMDTESFVTSLKSIAAWGRMIQLRTLKDGYSFLIDSLNGGPLDVNAMNSITENIIRVNIGIINRPYYYDNSPLSINYGAIGFVLAHEILHGFDERGSMYDYNGRQRMWWKRKTRDIYEEKVKCFADQYSNYTEALFGKNVSIDGLRTIDENIADNGAIYQAFSAYKMYSSLHPEMDLMLPLEMSKYTKDQLFFISFANTFCENYSKSFTLTTLLNDEHSPNKARVMVTLSNSKHFSKAFNCPIGTQMNPVRKCILW